MFVRHQARQLLGHHTKVYDLESPLQACGLSGVEAFAAERLNQVPHHSYFMVFLRGSIHMSCLVGISCNQLCELKEAFWRGVLVTICSSGRPGSLLDDVTVDGSFSPVNDTA
jgi:hypothetical protein